jgi:hypothetical protein
MKALRGRRPLPLTPSIGRIATTTADGSVRDATQKLARFNGNEDSEYQASTIPPPFEP